MTSFLVTKTPIKFPGVDNLRNVQDPRKHINHCSIQKMSGLAIFIYLCNVIPIIRLKKKNLATNSTTDLSRNIPLENSLREAQAPSCQLIGSMGPRGGDPGRKKEVLNRGLRTASGSLVGLKKIEFR